MIGEYWQNNKEAHQACCRFVDVRWSKALLGSEEEQYWFILSNQSICWKCIWGSCKGQCKISGCLPWKTNCLLTICRQSQLAGKSAENEMDSWENKHSGECRMDGLLKYSDSNEETDWERSLKKSFNPRRKEFLLQKRSLFFSTELIVSVQPARSLNPLLKGHNNPLHFNLQSSD